MPIYEFDCQDCGDSFESLVMSFTKIDGVTCPECNSDIIQKKISTFAVQGDLSSSTTFNTSAAACAPGGT